MTVSSMTGFARTEGTASGLDWVWEGRSVNARGLDLRFSLPPGLERIEAAAHRVASDMFARGSFRIALRLRRRDAAVRYRIDEDLLKQVIAAARAHRPPSRRELGVETLLGIRGVVEPVADEREDIDEAPVVRGFSGFADALRRSRQDEGARLAGAVGALLDGISRLVEQASGIAGRLPRERTEWLRGRLDELLAGDSRIPEEQLAQEAALIVLRGDVREELDRLRAHVGAARDLVGGGGTIGRRLDFLCQEFNREANTLCAKASSLDLTRTGLDLKAEIDRLREQVQNIE